MHRALGWAAAFVGLTTLGVVSCGEGFTSGETGAGGASSTTSSTTPSTTSPATSSGGGGSETITGSTGQGGTPNPCPTVPDPPAVVPCPIECTGGCEAAGVCNIDCNGDTYCYAEPIHCPPGLHCVVLCNGSEACDQAQIQCPDTFGCDLICEGFESCEEAVLHCTDGPCSIDCGTGELVCKSTTVHCGVGECSATCLSDGDPAPTLEACESACACTEC